MREGKDLNFEEAQELYTRDKIHDRNNSNSKNRKEKYQEYDPYYNKNKYDKYDKYEKYDNSNNYSPSYHSNSNNDKDDENNYYYRKREEDRRDDDKYYQKYKSSHSRSNNYYQEREPERENQKYYRKYESPEYDNRKNKYKGIGYRERDEYKSKKYDSRSNSKRRYSRVRSRSNSYHHKEKVDRTIEDAIRQAKEAERYDCTVLMYSLASEVNEKKIFDFFCLYNVLPVVDIKLLRDSRTRRSKNCCYVEFENTERAKQATALSGQLICGLPCQIVSSRAEKNRLAMAEKMKKEQLRNQNNNMGYNIVKYASSKEQIDVNDAPMKIYVGGLTENLAYITEDDLRNIFNFGDIDSIELHKDPISGKSKGYAFIQFHRGSKAREAIKAMNGFSYNGKCLKVGEANENNTIIKGKMYQLRQQQQQF